MFLFVKKKRRLNYKNQGANLPFKKYRGFCAENQQKFGEKMSELRKKSKAEPKISQAELENAIMAFKTKGGLIHKLPPQVAVRRDVVGSGFEGGFEAVVETL